MHRLNRTSNIAIPAMAEISRMLLDAGDVVTDPARAQVTRIGESFEFHRGAFASDLFVAADAGLSALYEIFDVEPVPRRDMHDGRSPIVLVAGPWQVQHQTLWGMLVPSSGPAQTVQGEVIRLTGRIAREILDNGSPNWDADFRRMLETIPASLASGVPLDEPQLGEARSLAHALRGGNDDGERVNRLSELAVAWVGRNPTPIPLGEVACSR